MEIRRRVTNLVIAARPTYQKPPPAITKSLADLEAMAKYQRWLRGVLSALAILAFGVSLVAANTVEQVSDALVTLLSIAGEVCILQVYQIKAKYAGVTDPIYRERPSVIHSPHFPMMLGEMFIWALHAPPFLSSVWEDAETLDFLVWLRLYTILLYLNHVSFGHRTFCRAISAVADIPLSTSFFLRTAFIFDTFRTSIAILFAGWMSLALLFSKCEGTSVWDSMYFCFVTAATIGYGDISPKTTLGRIVAFFSWVFGLTVVAWVVGLVHEALSLSTAEQNLFMLFQANEMCNVIPVEAAITIQRAFRLTLARKRHRPIILQSFMGYRLTSQVNKLRSLRRQIRSTEASFMAQLSSNDRPAPVGRKRTPRSRNSASTPQSENPLGSPLGKGTISPTSVAIGEYSARPRTTSFLNDVEQRSGTERLVKVELELDRMIAAAEQMLASRGPRVASSAMIGELDRPHSAALPIIAPLPTIVDFAALPVPREAALAESTRNDAAPVEHIPEESRLLDTTQPPPQDTVVYNDDPLYF
jgi:hypothetical protein